MNKNKILQAEQNLLMFFFLMITCLPIAGFAQADNMEFVFWNETTSKIALPTSNERWIDINPHSKVIAATFFKENGNAIGLGPNDEMRLYNVIHDKLGNTHYCYHQYYKNARVEGGDYNLHVNNETVFYAANGNIVKKINVEEVPQISHDEAFERAKNILQAKKYYWDEQALEEKFKRDNRNPDTSYKPVGELMWIKSAGPGNIAKYQLCYRFDINCLDPLISRRVFISTADGSLLKYEDMEIYCGGNGKTHANKVADIKQLNTGSSTSASAAIQQWAKDENKTAMGIGMGSCEYANVQTLYNGVRTVQIASTGFPVFSSDCNHIRTGNWNNDGNTDNPSPQPGPTTAGGGDVGMNSPTTEKEFGAQVHWGLDKSHYFYFDKFGRNGWNGTNGSINAFIYAYFTGTKNCWLVDQSPHQSNASFNIGTGLVKVGSGDCYLGASDGFGALDIMGHEFTHGVTQNNGSGGLDYSGESGALNESFSDIFGEAIENEGTGSNDFKVGNDRSDGAALHMPIRSFTNPNEFDQPDTYGGTYWYTGSDESIRVHKNSGVQNFMFYLLSQGGSGTNDNGTAYSVSGIGIVKAYKIAYQALTSGYYTSNSTHADSRRAWVRAAADLFGNCSNEVVQAKNAWAAVGVNAGSPPTSPISIICGTWPTTYSGNDLFGTYIITPLLCSPSNTTIISTATATSFSANEITLKPGFNAQAGCNFRAYIQSCPFPY